MDLAPFNVLVNAVLPGPIKTKMTESVLSPQQVEHIDNAIPLNRMAEPREIVNAILFLISDMNTYITGQSIVIDGGLTIQQVN
jgi:NAD(P)-dependent dehydrogenase (short-subunit alcohol dehydrogenase family)